MSLNTWNDSLDGLNLSGKVAEQSEQQREEAAAALAGIARTQKDEKKAQKYDVWLSELIKKLLQSSVYDHVINQLVPLLNARCPSHILLGYLLPLSDEYMIVVRETLGLTPANIPARMNVSERKTYSEPLAPELSSHLNIWMETLKGCITIDPSQTSTKKVNDMMNTVHEDGLTKLSAHVIAHFLYDRGIDIQPADAARVARGITKKMLLLIQGIQVDEFFSTEPIKLVQE
jgi:hypothetical protein